MLESSKVAIVTGASSGIGYAASLALSKAGVRVAVGARRIDRLLELEKQIVNNNSDDEGRKRVREEIFTQQKLDVTSKSDCDSFVDTVIKKWGRIDILINNAGLMPLSYFKNRKVEEWEQMIDVNIKGVLYCTSAVIPYMLDKKSGHIVNISSVAGRIVFAGGSVYCATKHAIAAFSEGLRKELSPEYKIRVTCIEPGAVSTELLETITDESMAKFIQASKNMETLQSEDIANAILYAIQAPNHVNVNEILIRPTAQER
ncbi:MAG: SDR family oxidoreductase [Nitrososphaeraceae archaeon]|nr:SDR family oxidoreductase [Nitrososphaeraceae archaeon]